MPRISLAIARTKQGSVAAAQIPVDHNGQNTDYKKRKAGFSMEVQTRDFGTVMVGKKDIIRFVSPLYGFEGDTEFIMLFDEDIGGAFCWLQSVKEPQICFILANASLVKDYSPLLSLDVKKSIGDETQEIWLVMVAADDFAKSTVNLKSPVIIGTKSMRACQTILEEDYPIRYALFQGKENAVC